MSRLTIFEGPDGGGKTTIIKNYFQGHDVVNHGPYEGIPVILPKYLKPMLKLRTFPIPMVYDRCWLAESIYGAVYRKGNDRLGSGGIRMLERVAYSVRAVVVLCMPEFHICQDAFNKRKFYGEEYLDNDNQLLQVYEGYKELKYATHLPLIIFDWTRHGYQGLIDLIEINRPRENEGPGIGHWNPGHVVLMVGEAPNKGDLVFVAGRGLKGGCSYWLANYMDRLGIPEGRLYWINAHDVKGKPTDPSFVEHLQPVRTVAFGKTAWAWCKQYGLTNIYECEHPNYWKRFHYNDVWESFESAMRIFK